MMLRRDVKVESSVVRRKNSEEQVSSVKIMVMALVLGGFHSVDIGEILEFCGMNPRFFSISFTYKVILIWEMSCKFQKNLS